MVILGQELAGHTIVASVDSPAPAEAYRALDAEGREVTLYVKEGISLEPGDFQGEIERLRSLSSGVQGIVPVLGGGVEGSAGWVTAQEDEDPSVEEMMSRLRPIAYDLVVDVARALSAAHALGLSHGDLGPHTVTITSQGAALVRTLGFHRLFGPPVDAMAEAARYRAPELFDGRPIDARTDVYGLGMLLYCVLSGRPPFEGRDDLVECAIHEVPPPLEGVPARVNAALARALSKDPDARFSTVEELVAAVRPLIVVSRRSVAAAPPPEEVAAPNAEPSEPTLDSRDTLPAGTLPPQAMRYPVIRISDPGAFRRAIRAGGAHLASALLGGALAVVMLSPRLAQPSNPPAPVPPVQPPAQHFVIFREMPPAVPPVQCDPAVPAAAAPGAAAPGVERPAARPHRPRRSEPAPASRNPGPSIVHALDEGEHPRWYGAAVNY